MHADIPTKVFRTRTFDIHKVAVGKISLHPVEDFFIMFFFTMDDIFYSYMKKMKVMKAVHIFVNN